MIIIISKALQCFWLSNPTKFIFSLHPEYNTLSSSLREYLRKFAENKKVVRDEDIREFFSQLTANKKQRPGSSVQLFCKWISGGSFISPNNFIVLA